MQSRKNWLKWGFLNLSEKWGKKYPVVIQSWENNWEKLTSYFQYTASIRKLIYTTNAVEGGHRQIGKVTKTKGPSPRIWRYKNSFIWLPGTQRKNGHCLCKLIWRATLPGASPRKG